MIAFWVLLALVLFRWALLLFGAALIVRPVSDCPACFRPTFLLRRPWLRRVAPSFEWRWCPRCGWQGLGRKQPVDDRGRARVPPASVWPSRRWG